MLQSTKVSKPSLKLIVIPLAVMLLLTILSGLNALYLTHTWEEASQSVSQQMTETVLLNNLHWHLSQIRTKIEKKQDHLQPSWDIAKQQLSQLNTFSGSNYQVRRLLLLNTSLFKENKIDAAHINRALLDQVLSEDFFNAQREQTQNNLLSLQQQTQKMITLITGTLVFLGLILMSITTYELTRLFVALKRSQESQMLLQEEERRRIAQDLHDGVVQEMIDLKRHYQADKIDHIIDNLRRVCHNLKPQILEDLGIVAAIDFLIDDLKNHGISDVSTNIDSEPLLSLPKQYELPLFRILQELCHNIQHHARASQVRLTVVYQPLESRWLSVSLKDNGTGFNTDLNETSGKLEDRQHMGLRGIKERIEQLGGTLQIQSATTNDLKTSRSGTLVQFQIPIINSKNG